MLRTKMADRIVCAVTALMLLVTGCLWGLVTAVGGDGSHVIGYEGLLFDQSRVHTIDITMAGWEQMIENALAEEYTECSIAIDGERFHHVAIRTKGNTSLSSVAAMGSSRYSFKVEFDHYVKGMTYHGLDKLSLNNLIQDATMMKDYLAYTLMGRMGVPSSLCSYVQINVNGEPWGLYLAVEGVEEAFLDRNGMSRGELYKPDSMSFGGGRGNGRDFSFGQLQQSSADKSDASREDAAQTPPAMPQGDFSPSGGASAQPPAAPGGANEGSQSRRGFSPGGFGMGSDDVKLIYSDDDPDSYSNIFSNAKTKISRKDKARLIEALRRLNAQENLDDTVNQDEVIRYLAVHNFLCNDDSYTGMMVHNYYLYEEKGKLSIIPWDYNLSFGGFSASANATSTVNSPIDSPVSGGTVESRPLIAWIFSDDASLATYHQTYDRFISENIENGWLSQEISRVQAMITPYLEKDASAFYDMAAFEKAIDTLQAFCQKRNESIRGQLNGSIPATSQEQRENSAALVDASELSTADMGSMNSGKGEAGGFEAPAGMPDFSSADGFTPPASMPDDMDTNNASFGGSAGSSGDSARSTAAPSDAPAASPAPAAGDANVRPGLPIGFSDSEAPANAGFPWALVAAYSALLVAALLIIRRAGSHNG